MLNEKLQLLEISAHLVATTANYNKIQLSDMPKHIRTTYESLLEIIDNKNKLIPAVDVEFSITNDAICCLECGKKYKSLKRHIKAQHNLSPDEYRQKWGLDNTYPMISKYSSDQRSKLAKKSGLGKRQQEPKAKTSVKKHPSKKLNGSHKGVAKTINHNINSPVT